METKEKVDLIALLVFVGAVCMGFGLWLGNEIGLKANKIYTIEREADGFKIFDTYESNHKLIKSDTIKIY